MLLPVLLEAVLLVDLLVLFLEAEEELDVDALFFCVPEALLLPFLLAVLLEPDAPELALVLRSDRLARGLVASSSSAGAAASFSFCFSAILAAIRWFSALRSFFFFGRVTP